MAQGKYQTNWVSVLIHKEAIFVAMTSKGLRHLIGWKMTGQSSIQGQHSEWIWLLPVKMSEDSLNAQFPDYSAIILYSVKNPIGFNNLILTINLKAKLG